MLAEKQVQGYYDLDKGQERKLVMQCRTDPAWHIKHLQGVNLVDFQEQKIVNAVRDYPRVAIKACHGVGKTFTLSRVAIALLSSFPKIKIITTAPTNRQVKNVFWSEMNTGYIHSAKPLGGRMLTTEWHIEKDRFAMGFMPQKGKGKRADGDGQGEQSSFQGFHSPRIVVIFDEATGIPEAIWDQCEGLLTGAWTRFVAIGNPTTKNCRFYKCFKSPLFKKVHISCFDSPNLEANGIFDIEDLQNELDLLAELSKDDRLLRIDSYTVVDMHLTTLKWVIERALEWGVDHPLFLGKVLGEFPEEDEHSLISLGDIESAQAREVDANDAEVHYIGVDPARQGKDDSEVCHIHGYKQIEKIKMRHRTIPEQVGTIIRYAKEIPNAKKIIILVDSTGLGAGVIDGLQEAQDEERLPDSVELVEIHFGARPFFEEALDEEDKKEIRDRFYNLKAQMFWAFRSDVKKMQILVPENTTAVSEYAKEFPMIRWKPNSKGQICIESKDDYKVRTGLGSPDAADAMVIANFGRYMDFHKNEWLDTDTSHRPMAGSLRSTEDIY